MEKKKMIELRNLLYKATAIGFIFFFIGIVFYLCLPGYIYFVWSGVFGVNAMAIPFVAFLSFAIFKSFIVSLFLIPALALHWQYCKK